MTQTCWWLARKLARLLEPAEREAVLGDVTESGETGLEALRGIAGLTLRRQAALWRDWRPWLATVAMVIPAGFLLTMASVWLASSYDLDGWLLWNYKVIDPALLHANNISVFRATVGLIQATLTLIAWTWSGGYVLGSLSGRARWLNATLFSGILLSGPVSHAWPEGDIGVATIGIIGLSLVVSYCGMRLAGRSIGSMLRATLWAAALMSAVTVRIWFWWPKWTGERRALLLLAAYFPLAYLAAAALWSRRNSARLIST